MPDSRKMGPRGSSLRSRSLEGRKEGRKERKKEKVTRDPSGGYFLLRRSVLAKRLRRLLQFAGRPYVRIVMQWFSPSSCAAPGELIMMRRPGWGLSSLLPPPSDGRTKTGVFDFGKAILYICSTRLTWNFGGGWLVLAEAALGPNHLAKPTRTPPCIPVGSATYVAVKTNCKSEQNERKGGDRKPDRVAQSPSAL